VVGPSGSSNSSDGQFPFPIPFSIRRMARFSTETLDRMIAAVLFLLSLTVLVGAILLTPQRTLLARWPRRTVAATHGTLGALGLAGALWTARLGATQAIWLAIALLAGGLIAGGTIFVTCRHRRNPPPLILALHVVFAGIGYLLVVGLFLSGPV
jgi:hypothetical protein